MTNDQPLATDHPLLGSVNSISADGTKLASEPLEFRQNQNIVLITFCDEVLAGMNPLSWQLLVRKLAEYFSVDVSGLAGNL